MYEPNDERTIEPEDGRTYDLGLGLINSSLARPLYKLAGQYWLTINVPGDYAAVVVPDDMIDMDNASPLPKGTRARTLLRKKEVKITR